MLNRPNNKLNNLELMESLAKEVYNMDQMVSQLISQEDPPKRLNPRISRT
jgi:hypothetical protein